MLVTEQDRLRSEIRRLAEAHGSSRSALLPILQEVQRSDCGISEFAMQIIADALGIHPVEVYSVVSFYSFLESEPRGRFIIRLCRTMACDMAGRDDVARQLESDLGIRFGESTPDGRFTLEWCACMGMCDQGPAMLVNDKVHTRLTPSRVHSILESCRQSFGIFAFHGGDS